MDSNFEVPLVSGNVKRAMADLGAKSRDLWQVDPRRLKTLPGFNVRVDNDRHREYIRQLADSMKVLGYHQHKPMAGHVVKEDGEDVVLVYDGHCRLEAVLLAIEEGAEILSVPVVVSDRGTNLEDLTVALVTSNNGKELDPSEKAVVVKRLINYGWDEPRIAEKLGFSHQYIRDLLMLSSAPREIRQMVSDNKVSASLAVQSMKKHGDKAVEKLQQAGEVATAAGKQRVTAKHVEVKPRAAKFDLIAHVERQRAFSEKTFGPGPRVNGILDHVRKEIGEIESDPANLVEWIDLVLLGLDGAWRSGATSEEVAKALADKLTRNEQRSWPDWRTADPEKAIEHDRSDDEL